MAPGRETPRQSQTLSAGWPACGPAFRCLLATACLCVCGRCTAPGLVGSGAVLSGGAQSWSRVMRNCCPAWRDAACSPACVARRSVGLAAAAPAVAAAERPAGKARVALQQHLHLRRHRQRHHDVRPEQALLHRKQHEALGSGRADGRLHPLHDARRRLSAEGRAHRSRSGSAAAAPCPISSASLPDTGDPRHRARQGRGRSRQEILQVPGDRAAAHGGVRRPRVPAARTPRSGTSS